MKYFDLTPEEEEIEKALEKGEFIPVKNFPKVKKMMMEIARNTLAKNANINLRLSQKVLIKLKAKAAAYGLPYQTLASSVLHRFALS